MFRKSQVVRGFFSTTGSLRQAMVCSSGASYKFHISDIVRLDLDHAYVDVDMKSEVMCN